MKKTKGLLTLLTLALLASCGGGKNTSPTSPNKPGSNESTNSSSQPQIEKEMTGNGTKEDPYIISNKYQLEDFNNTVTDNADYLDKYYSVTADIDAEGMEWVPVATATDPFTGVLYGNGHTISNLKITNFEDNTSIGFFSATDSAVIESFHLKDFTIDFDVKGKNSTIVVGGLVGLASTTSIYYSSIEYSKFEISSLQSGTSYFYGGGLVGYVDIQSDDEYSYSVDCFGSYVKGDVKVDLSDTTGVSSMVGGLIGVANTHSSNIFALQNCYFNGSVLSGTYAAGLVAYMTYYASVVDSFAYGTSIEATDTDGAYAGGLVGRASMENSVIGTYSEFNTITAAASTSTVYKSWAGATVAYSSDDWYEEYINFRGTALYSNYKNSAVTLSADNKEEVETVATASNAFFTNTLNLSSDFWNLGTTYPTLVKEPKETLTRKRISIDGDDQAYSTDGEGYDYSLAEKLNAYTKTQAGYSFYGLTYDQDGKVEWRWYTPISNNTTLYAGLADLSELKGTYDVDITYSGTTTSGVAGKWAFDDEYFYWIHTENSVGKYTYHFDGKYIVVEEAVDPVSGDLGTDGGYEDCVFILADDKTITTLDVNAEECIYTASKTTSTVTIPNYKGDSILGAWKGVGVELSLYEDAQVIATTSSSTSKKYGGFSKTGTTVTIKADGVSNLGTFTYDATNNILYSGSNLLAREAVSTIFKTSEVDLLIGLVGNKKYVVKDGVLGDTSKLSGTLADGQTITFDGTEYTVTGTTLKKVEKEDPEPETKNTYVGTWTLKAGANNGIKLVLNEDGTGSYAGSNINYTVTGNTIKFTNGYDFIFIYDSDKQTLTGSYYDDDLMEDVNITSTAYEAFKEETATYVGTWTMDAGLNKNNKLILKTDGTGTYNGTAFTYTVNGTTITFAVGDMEFTLTYDSSKQTLSGKYEQDYNENDIASTAYEAESSTDINTISVDTVSGTYTGTMAATSITITLNKDGSATLSDGTNNRTFNWTVDSSTGKLTISNWSDPTNYFDDLTLTYDAEKKTLNGTIMQDNEYEMKIATTKNS